jgi:hypothetical protein
LHGLEEAKCAKKLKQHGESTMKKTHEKVIPIMIPCEEYKSKLQTSFPPSSKIKHIMILP